MIFLKCDLGRSVMNNKQIINITKSNSSSNVKNYLKSAFLFHKNILFGWFSSILSFKPDCAKGVRQEKFNLKKHNLRTFKTSITSHY